MDISTARVEPHMIAKSEDFEFGFRSVIRNSAILDRVLTAADVDYVAGGYVNAIQGTMTFTVDPIWANGRGIEMPAYLGAASQTITVSMPQNFPRIDIVQVRGAFESFDRQQRAFFDPEIQRVHYLNVDTKSRLSTEIVVKRGTEGASHAPDTDSGYIKLAEIHVDPETFSLTEDNIKNVTAVSQGGGNTGWTNETARTFRPSAGGLTDLSERINTEAQARERGDAETLASAKKHSDSITSLEASARKQGDADTLEQARLMLLEAQADTNEILERLADHPDMVDGAGRDLRIVFGIKETDPAVYLPLIMAEIRRRCNNNGEIDGSRVPSFSGIMLGDYVDGLDLSAIPAENNGDAGQPWNDTYKNNRIIVSGFNTFKDMGSSEVTRNHILFTFRNIPLRKRMNASGSNSNGYAASEMKVFLEGANGNGTGDMAGVTTAAFLNAMRAQMGDYFLTITKAHSMKASSTFMSYTLFLPSEIEVLGGAYFGDEGVEMPALTSPVRAARVGWLTPIQLPIFAKSFTYRIKRRNGLRQWWWTQTPHAGGSSSFANVNLDGFVSYGNAGSVGGCAPAFCVA